MQLLLY